MAFRASSHHFSDIASELNGAIVGIGHEQAADRRRKSGIPLSRKMVGEASGSAGIRERVR
jgi:hypothetical protein